MWSVRVSCRSYGCVGRRSLRAESRAPTREEIIIHPNNTGSEVPIHMLHGANTVWRIEDGTTYTPSGPQIQKARHMQRSCFPIVLQVSRRRIPALRCVSSCFTWTHDRSCRYGGARLVVGALGGGWLRSWLVCRAVVSQDASGYVSIGVLVACASSFDAGQLWL